MLGARIARYESRLEPKLAFHRPPSSIVKYRCRGLPLRARHYVRNVKGRVRVASNILSLRIPRSSSHLISHSPEAPS